jgi:hypothetical protein
MKKLYVAILFLITLTFIGCSQSDSESGSFEDQVNEYIKKFPYQDTHKYAVLYTGGDPAKLNTWLYAPEPELVKAGEDGVVRMNNDTFYNAAVLYFKDEPVVIKSSAPSEDRFNALQLVDDRNVNYRNIVYPKGEYTFYYGNKPEEIQGEAIEVPSSLSIVLVRIEVKDKDDSEDVAAAKAVYQGLTIRGGQQPSEFPQLDLLSEYPKSVSDEASRRMDETFSSIPFSKIILRHGQVLGEDVSYLEHAAATKGAWGGPDPSHSAYETIFFDKNGDEFIGSKGTYTVTSEEPPVDAFWSVTVYDTDRGGFFHPNENDRYHINNTTAVRNENGTVTFTFKQNCGDSDPNCLEVPAGRFDLVVRYYLPREEIITGNWTFPKIELKKN